MKAERSWTRLQYAYCYGAYRSYGDNGLDGMEMGIPPEIERAAGYSYQAYGYEVSGWMNRRRHTQFLNKKAMSEHGKQDLPF